MLKIFGIFKTNIHQFQIYNKHTSPKKKIQLLPYHTQLFLDQFQQLRRKPIGHTPHYINILADQNPSTTIPRNPRLPPSLDHTHKMAARFSQRVFPNKGKGKRVLWGILRVVCHRPFTPRVAIYGNSQMPIVVVRACFAHAVEIQSGPKWFNVFPQIMLCLKIRWF